MIVKGLKDNSFLAELTSHLDVSGFYHQQLPIVYLDLYFARVVPGEVAVYEVISALISSLTSSSRLWLDPANFISSAGLETGDDDRISCQYLGLPSHDSQTFIVSSESSLTFCLLDQCL